MRNGNILSQFKAAKQEGQKQVAMLLDPDKTKMNNIEVLCRQAMKAGVNYFFVGGSLLTSTKLNACIHQVKNSCNIPVIIFPGDETQLSDQADAILLLSLISGRNADLLIGKHVQAAPHLKSSGIEIISTGYMLIESGRITTAHYMSNTLPIPHDKSDIAVNTALAGEMLGLQCIYLEAGSGADMPVSSHMIECVKQSTSIPLIVGGGIRTAEMARAKCAAGADIVVLGSALEENFSLLDNLVAAVHMNHIM